MRLPALSLAATLALAAAPAAADPPAPPPNPGLGFTIAGGVLVGLGGATLATTPLCRLSGIRADAQGSCIVTSIVSGGVLATVGIPLLVVGAQKAKVTVAPTVGGAVLSGSW
jgi:hypothetical protein